MNRIDKKNIGHSIFLNIAGFNIELFIYASKHYFEKQLIKQLLKNITVFYQGFIMSNKPESINLHIIFHRLPLLITKQNYKHYKNFSALISSQTRNIVNTFIHVSFPQIIQLLLYSLQKIIINKKCFIIHGSSCLYNNQALIFTGVSGSGKSTAISLLKDTYPPLTDDMGIIRKIAGKYYLYQIPNVDKYQWIKKTSQPYQIKKIFFLKKSKKFTLSKIHHDKKVLNLLLKQLWNQEKEYGRQVKNLIEFVSDFDKFYYLNFAKNRKQLVNFLAQSI